MDPIRPSSRQACSAIRGGLCLGQWLAGNGDLARIDAELLAAHVLQVDRARVIAFPDWRLTASQASALEQLSERLRRREPLAYLLGEKEFYGRAFAVDESVLVPRPETERLAELALRRAPAEGRVLDLGTGSGCIAVTLKAERPDLAVAGADICERALAVAAGNAARHGATVEFARGDWLDGWRGPFHCIVCNPPYIPAGHADLAALCREPQLALIAGPEGLDALFRIIGQAGSRLAEGGCLLLEHGCEQGGAVRRRLAAWGWRQIETHCDLAGRERVTAARKPFSGSAPRLPAGNEAPRLNVRRAANEASRPQSPLKESLQCVERHTVQGFFQRLLAGWRWPAWERGRPARMRARGPRSQGPLAAGWAIRTRELGSRLVVGTCHGR